MRQAKLQLRFGVWRNLSDQKAALQAAAELRVLEKRAAHVLGSREIKRDPQKAEGHGWYILEHGRIIRGPFASPVEAVEGRRRWSNRKNRNVSRVVGWGAAGAKLFGYTT